MGDRGGPVKSAVGESESEAGAGGRRGRNEKREECLDYFGLLFPRGFAQFDKKGEQGDGKAILFVVSEPTLLVFIVLVMCTARA